MCVRILSVYVRGVYPDDLKDEMSKLVHYIVQVYAVSWFRIKMDNKFKHQPLYIFEMIQDMKRQSDQTVKDESLGNLKNNAFGLLPENMLFCMIASDDSVIRKKAIDRILKMRRDSLTQEQPRLSENKKIPAINFEAEEWSALVDLDKIKGNFEPPLTQDLSDSVLEEAFDDSLPLQFPSLPAHSQTVERAVKLVSEASQLRYGTEGRHLYCLTKVSARKEHPSFESKRSYSEKN